MLGPSTSTTSARFVGLWVESGGGGGSEETKRNDYLVDLLCDGCEEAECVADQIGLFIYHYLQNFDIVWKKLGLYGIPVWYWSHFYLFLGLFIIVNIIF